MRCSHIAQLIVSTSPITKSHQNSTKFVIWLRDIRRGSLREEQTHSNDRFVGENIELQFHLYLLLDAFPYAYDHRQSPTNEWTSIEYRFYFWEKIAGTFPFRYGVWASERERHVKKLKTNIHICLLCLLCAVQSTQKCGIS